MTNVMMFFYCFPFSVTSPPPTGCCNPATSWLLLDVRGSATLAMPQSQPRARQERGGGQTASRGPSRRRRAGGRGGGLWPWSPTSPASLRSV